MEIILDRYRGYVIEEVFRYKNGTSDWSFYKDGSEKVHSAKEKTLLWVCNEIDSLIEESI